uniref:Immunoglobulin subtype n=1 Tax=Echinococcus granulosus TaxID=6210 RepID=A0A068WSR6_ECHGR|nr:Immunoglobulin subtype [Echinococcus granulosus]
MYFGLVPQFLPLLLCTSLVHCDLVIKPPLLIAEAYHDAFFLCQIDSNILSVIWTLPSSEVVLANKTSTDNRFRNSGGFLFISNVSFADSGDYECSIDENTSSVGVLEVFVMPSYTLDLSLVFIYDIRRLVL